MSRVLKVVSGGQTGDDRAALDAARAAGLPCGGWCPRGRLAEDGPIDLAYPVVETPSTDFAPTVSVVATGLRSWYQTRFPAMRWRP